MQEDGGSEDAERANCSWFRWVKPCKVKDIYRPGTPSAFFIYNNIFACS